MRRSTNVNALLHGYCCQNLCAIRSEDIINEKNSLYGIYLKNTKFPTQSTLDGV
jgi:hypothetical protein